MSYVIDTDILIYYLKNNPTADMDLLIASICMANDLTLVSNNTRHFGRIAGLKLENWSL
jgi:predicted nucleic acid-binding protein